MVEAELLRCVAGFEPVLIWLNLPPMQGAGTVQDQTNGRVKGGAGTCGRPEAGVAPRQSAW